MFIYLHSARDEALTISKTTITRWSLTTNPATQLARIFIPPESVCKLMIDPGGRVQTYGGIAVAPDSLLFAVEQLYPPEENGKDSCVIELRSWENFSVARNITVPRICDWLYSIDSSPDGRWLVIGAGNPEEIFLLDWQTGKVVSHHAVGGYSITGLTFDPTSTFIAGIACDDAWGHLVIWRIDPLTSNQISMTQLADNVRDNYVLRVVHWKLDRAGINWPDRDLADTMGTTVFSPDGCTVVFSLNSSYSECGIELVSYDVVSGQRLWCARSEVEGTGRCIFTPDGKALLVPLQDGTLLKYRAEDGTLLDCLLSDLDKPVQALAFDHDGKTLWLATKEALVQYNNPQKCG